MKSTLIKKTRTASKNTNSKLTFSNLLRSAKRGSGYAFAATLGIWLPRADAATLVNIDVTSTANYPIGSAAVTLTNSGTLVGDFVSSGAIVPGITNVDGVGAVAMLDVPGAGAGGGRSYVGPATPAALGGNNRRTIEAWIFDPGPAVGPSSNSGDQATDFQQEKTIFSFGRRDAPLGANFALEHGRSADIGALSTSTIQTTALGGIGWNGANNVVTNNWTYIVATYDGRKLSVYSDGVLRNSHTYDPYVAAIVTALRSADNSTNTLLRIARQTIGNGASGQCIGPFYLGRLRVQDTNMSTAQVSAQYNTEKGDFNYKDSDANGLADWWEVRYFGAIGQNPSADPDGDGATNLQEYNAGSNPLVADTDGDGLTDGQEINTYHTDPTKADTDGDGLSDGYEVNTSHTNPLLADTDGDGFSDGVEVAKGTDPNSAASFPAPLVNLDSTGLPLGALPSWANTGTAGGTFDTVSATNAPTVTNLFGIHGVNFTTVGGAANGGRNGCSYLGPAVPSQITGAGARTIEMWVESDVANAEHTMFAYGARGANALNVSFGEGRNSNFGACAQWGTPDIGWNNQEVYGRWVNLAYTYDGTATRLYVDGKQVNEEVYPLITLATDVNGQPYHFRMGRQNANNSSFTNIDSTGFGPHTIAKVKVFDVALDGPTISAHFNADKGTFGLTDTDGDGMPDWFEDRFGLNKNNPADAGQTNGLSDISNLAKYQAGYPIPTQGTTATIALDPTKPDYDGDGVKDGAEMSRIGGHYRPGQFAPTNPFNRDTDGDAVSDGAETDTGVYVNPLNAGSDPLTTDSDGDGYSDGLEVAQGSNPNDLLNIPSPLPLISLDATTNYPFGPLNVWTNSGRTAGDFSAAVGSSGNTNNMGGTVQQIQGVNGVTLGGGTFVGPAASLLSGDPNYTVIAWVYNPTIEDEESLICWGRRGGPNGTMSAFTDGSDGTWGAFTHWGADLSWNSANVRTPARWKFLVGTWDASQNLQSCYTDSGNSVILANSNTIAPLNIFDQDTLGNTIHYRVGDENNGDSTPSGLAFTGTLGEIRIYSRVVPISEIVSNFNAGASKYGILPDVDGIPIWWKRVYGLAIGVDIGNQDPDGDGLSNLGEYSAGTNPNNPDTDGDGLTDGQEVNTYNSNPNNKDTDLDGLPDNIEVALGTNLGGAGADTDGDGFPDGVEVLYGSDPNNPLSVPDFTTPRPFVNLDATGLPLGALPSWTNNNALGWKFIASTNTLGVQSVDGAKGVTFDGNAKYYTGPGMPSYFGGNAARTIAAWIWDPAAVPEQTILAWGRRGGNPDGSNTALSHGTDPAFGAIQFWGTFDSPWGTNTSQIVSNVHIGKWTFIAFTYDPATSNKVAYVDGAVANSAVTPGPLATWLYDPTDPLNANNQNFGRSLAIRVGAQNDPGGAPTGPYASSTIAKIRAYNTALTAQQIADQYNAEVGQFPGLPVIKDVKVNTGTGIITFDWTPAPGKTYAVETNSSLSNTSGWAAEATGQTSGAYSHAVGGSQRFYRLRVEN